MVSMDGWTIGKEGTNESDMILKRSYEIKALLEESQPKAIENIKKKE